ncbi:hydrogenase nickel incorporation protein HypB [Streptomyces sp. NPDC051018]|uniref:hydrogenase nickel incorporation protein HypB n=1 Tax=Streptomyces sp. NPDC051018 TaxID=3365639 RepID=UPI0037ACFF3E
MCRSVDVRQAVLAKNDVLASELRAELARRRTVAVNLMSSPGSGKTALLEGVLRTAVRRGIPAAALTADLATENDARRLARSGAPVRQVLTGGLCHLEAAQVRGHVDAWLPDGVRLLCIENVGNLVCPASYDLGETLRIALMSVTEGEDKPVKYPTAFGQAHLVVLTKTDLSLAAGFDEEAFRRHVAEVNPGVEVLPTSARTGLGVDALVDRMQSVLDGSVPHRPLLAAEHLSVHIYSHPSGHPHPSRHSRPTGNPGPSDHTHPSGHPSPSSHTHPADHTHPSGHPDPSEHAHPSAHPHAAGNDDPSEHPHQARPHETSAPRPA